MTRPTILNRNPLKLWFVLIITACIGACTWVKKNPESDTVRVIPTDRVVGCTKLGSVATNTLSNITVVKRNAKKIASELETIAKNEAIESGADTISPITEIVDGRQTFVMYKCLKN
jgi:hypothetical protein